MIDVDSVRCSQDGTAYLHWAAVNISGSDMSSGVEVHALSYDVVMFGTIVV